MFKKAYFSDMETNNFFNEDWKILIRFFPSGWMVKSKELGAFKRSRSIKSPKYLLRLLLIHLVEGCSLRETSAIASASNLCKITDVGLLKRLKASSEWLRWMSLTLINETGIVTTPPKWLKNYVVKSVDASVITEPGKTGGQWRLHYSINLYSLQCDQFIITDQSKGEGFKNFKITKGDLLIGDRVYGNLAGFKHILDNGGQYISRIKRGAFSIRIDGQDIDLLEHVKHLEYGQICDLQVQGFTKSGLSQDVRLCILRKSKTETEKSIKQAKRKASRSQLKVTTETIEYCKYFIIATSLKGDVAAKQILELYRFRWQVEIAFKRLKSILGMGYLPKKDPDSCMAWLHGKMFVALLAQKIVEEGRKISPWGYLL